MNLQFYIEKLENSDVYKDFVKKNKNAYFYSGFFSIDKEGKDNQVHLDFFGQTCLDTIVGLESKL